MNLAGVQSPPKAPPGQKSPLRISAGLYFSVTEQCPVAFWDAAETNATK